MSEKIIRVVVTCRTEGCTNENYTLIVNDPGDVVVCGPCGVELVMVEPEQPE